MYKPSFNEIILYDDLIHHWRRWSKETTQRQAWNLVQLAAAQRLIKHYFGKKWFNEYIDKEGQLSDHPLSLAVWSGKPSKLIKITSLGIALKVLNFEKRSEGLPLKIPKLKEASSSFEKTYYELKCAATYAGAGFHVVFLRERKNKKTPDLLVKGSGEEIFIECKKRDPKPTGDIDKKINGALDRISDAHAQIKDTNNCGIVYLEVEDHLNENSIEVNKYIKYISYELPFFESIQCVVLTSLNVFTKNEVVNRLTVAQGIPNKSVEPKITREVWCDPSIIGKYFPRHLLHFPGGPPDDI